MHPRVIAVALVGTLLTGSGLALALVVDGTAPYVPDWPSLGGAGLVVGLCLAIVGLVGPAVALRWVFPGRSVLDGAIAGLLTACLPVFGILMPWLGLMETEQLRLQAEADLLPQAEFGVFLSNALITPLEPGDLVTARRWATTLPYSWTNLT